MDEASLSPNAASLKLPKVYSCSTSMYHQHCHEYQLLEMALVWWVLPSDLRNSWLPEWKLYRLLTVYCVCTLQHSNTSHARAMVHTFDAQGWERGVFSNLCSSLPQPAELHSWLTFLFRTITNSTRAIAIASVLLFHCYSYYYCWYHRYWCCFFLKDLS